MLAKATTSIPAGENYLFEPKWDGFRCIIFRDANSVELGSRNEKPLTRYFPEVVEAVKANLPERCVVDGEIVIATADGLDFDALQQRIHPAASRVNMLAEKTPASFVAFDLLALDDEDLRRRPFAERRSLLEKSFTSAESPIYITPTTTDNDEAQRWFTEFEGAGFDGVVAKDLGLQYQENKRVMLKIKHARTADCVVAGFRWHKSGGVVGSLLLGLFDDDGVLHHIGVTASFTMARRKELLAELEPFRMQSLDGHPWSAWAKVDEDSQRKPGATSRWNAKKELNWEPLRPDRVVEIAYDQLQGNRLRHTGQFRRWRDDRTPESCTYSQLETAVPAQLKAVFTRR